MSKERPAYHAAVWVALKAGNNLYMHRRHNTGFLDGYYDFASGHIEYGESILEAAIRETKEEYCVDIEASDLKLIAVNKQEFDLPYLGYVFVCEKWQGAPKIGEPEKCDDMQLFEIGNLPEKRTITVHTAEAGGFDGGVTYNFIDLDKFAELMHETWPIG